jgi:hypothetical protein
LGAGGRGFKSPLPDSFDSFASFAGATAMIVERDVDCGAIYERQRHELLAFARGLEDAQLRTLVPATPLWSVRDVLAHVIGITADLNAGRFGDGYADVEAWTAAQVDDRRDRTVDELGREWDTEAPRFEEGLRLLGYEIGSHYVGDLAQHDADARAALGRPHLDDEEVYTVGLDFYVDYAHQSLVAAGVEGALRSPRRPRSGRSAPAMSSRPSARAHSNCSARSAAGAAFARCGRCNGRARSTACSRS